MKKNYSIIKTMVVLMILVAGKIGAQCTNTAQFGTATAPAQGNSVTITTCIFAGEYSTINSVVSGNTYSSTSSIAGDIITIRSGTSNGPVVAFGTTPLTWTATTAGAHFAHVNTTGCGSNSTCRTAIIGCLAPPPCTFATQFGSATASSTSSVTVTTCIFGGEYANVTFTATGNYTATSTGGSGNYITITNSLNVVLVSGLSPLSVTIPSTAVYRMHISTSSACGTDASCHTLVVNGVAPPAAPANDLCANATSITTSGSFTGTTINATLETPAVPACITSAPSQPGVWYTLTGNGNKLGVDLTCASAWDSKVWVFTGACGAFTCVTGNDDSGPICPSSAAASATWCSQVGVQYRILVAGFSSASAFTLNTTQTVVPVPSITTSTNSVCAGSSSTFTASGLSTYTWNPGALTGSVQVFTPASTTAYTVTGIEATTGCPSSANSILTVNLVPSIAVNSGSICSGNSFTMVPSGASTYTFSSGSAIVSPVTNTSYSVTGTSAQGCVSSNTAVSSVVVNTTPTVVVNSGAICTGSSFTLSPSGATSYTYSSGPVVSPTANTSYTVTGTTSGCSANAVATVTVNAIPTVVVNSGAICNGSSFTLNPSGATSYTYSSGPIVTPTANTSYTVTGTTSGCSADAVASVTVNALPSVTAVSSTSILCVGQTASLTASGATTYTWNTSANTAVIAISPTVTTTYTVDGSDANGCTNTFTISQAVTPCTGITAKSSNLNGLSVYPNPNFGQFTIELNNGALKTIEIMDVTGRIVLSNATSNDKIDFNINTLANGVYYVKIQSNNSVEVVKIVKQ
ncbi:MAG: T9SS type A sorting domain-containing protein [Bacteroidota bacterium]|nr:T9SS type A sorting domain-containing protein [Bacteroidota bacterium]MDP3147262.1 T9SS type A sorting domain-containing protein [Bacteroidota bacterium]